MAATTEFQIEHFWYRRTVWFLSLALFFAGHFLPIFYLGDHLQPGSGIPVGWGVLGVIPMLVLPVYLIAVTNRKRPVLAASMALLALFLWLLWLWVEEVLINEAGGTREIVAYGWGYVVLLLSLITLFVGELQFALYRTARSVSIFKCATVLAVAMVIPCLLFVKHHYVGYDSVNQIFQRQQVAFEIACKSTGVEIIEELEKPAASVFVSSAWSKLINAPGEGRLKFYEQLSKFAGWASPSGDRTLPYVRFSAANKDGVFVDNLLSEYYISSQPIPENKHPNLFGQIYYITRSKDNKLMAKISYVNNKKSEEFCGYDASYGAAQLSGGVYNAIFYLLKLNDGT